MRGDEIKELLRRQPFEPVKLSLPDGRAIVVRHPDQVVIAQRHVIVGLAQIKHGRKRVSTPRDGDTIAKDWILLDLIHIVSVEPVNGQADRHRRGNGRPHK